MSGLFLGIAMKTHSYISDDQEQKDSYEELRKNNPQQESMYLVKTANPDSVSFAKVRRPIKEVE